mmetsp:Transcript_89505/g.154904  ORF Transcript_89505/g.154904 Transcript_89505/m.154904 type:complete len:80 (+) Transcript_89505:409-648(+)
MRQKARELAAKAVVPALCNEPRKISCHTSANLDKRQADNMLLRFEYNAAHLARIVAQLWLKIDHDLRATKLISRVLPTS